jgi:hypothetical protein
MIADFIAQVDRKAPLYVNPPTDVIFLCGGKTPKKSKKPASLRDAFLKIPDNPALNGRVVRLAEKVNTFHMERAAYEDLLAFELDFAQVCGLVVLFSESEGSIAELGSFSVIDEISDRLLVFVRDHHLTYDSFIKLGPIQQLRNRYGDQAVFVLNDDDIDLKNRRIADVNIAKLSDRVTPAINVRFEEVRPKTTFNRKSTGDIIKLMTGLVQDFGALKAKELRTLLKTFGIAITDKRIDRLMLCAEAALWVVRERRGFDVFYIALPAKRDALSIRFNKKAKLFNRARRRQTIRAHWEETDPIRFSGIVTHAGDGQ